jgi:tRNA-dihydrouridine synthase
MKTFWQDLAEKKKPFSVLAPMDGATDSIFRRVVGRAAKPDVFFTEFANVEGLFSAGAHSVERRLLYTAEERPLIAQIWGLKPEHFYKAARYLSEKGFDGIDINMGCPVHSVTFKGACSALIKNPSLAKEIIEATKEGVKVVKKSEILSTKTKTILKTQNKKFETLDHSNLGFVSNLVDVSLPVSVKTRIGYSEIQTEEWIGFLLEQDIDALTVHGRTVREMSKVPAHWDEIGKVVTLRNSMKKKTVIIGNGDVKSIHDGKEKADVYGVEGIMIGRGIFENVWVFNKDIDSSTVSIEARLAVLKEHLSLYETEKQDKLPYHTLKKYFKIYIRDFDGASELRSRLMETNSVQEVYPLIDSFIKST